MAHKSVRNHSISSAASVFRFQRLFCSSARRCSTEAARRAGRVPVHRGFSVMLRRWPQGIEKRSGAWLISGRSRSRPSELSSRAAYPHDWRFRSGKRATWNACRSPSSSRGFAVNARPQPKRARLPQVLGGADFFPRGLFVVGIGASLAWPGGGVRRRLFQQPHVHSRGTSVASARRHAPDRYGSTAFRERTGLAAPRRGFVHAQSARAYTDTSSR